MQTYHEAAQRTRGRDIAFWKDFGDPHEVAFDDNRGLYHQEHFTNGFTMASATANGGYYSYQDTGNTITQKDDYPGGVLLFTSDGTDEDEVWLQAGGVAGGMFNFTATANQNYDQWFETVLAVDRITANAVAYFWGLAEKASAVANHLVDATGALQTARAVIGFHSLVANPESMRAVYNSASGTVVSLGTAATLAVDTYMRFGIRYRRRTGMCEFWVNGLKKYQVAISTANFPDGVNLTPMWGFKSTTATATNLSLDSWRMGLRFGSTPV